MNGHQRIFAKHANLFATGAIYSTAVIVWSFLSQVLRDGKEASCQAAVARVVSHCQQQGLPAPTEDTGDYCRARAKLSAAALRELSCEVANRPGRLEPRVLKRRRHGYKLMQKSRSQLRSELRKHCT